MSKENVKIFYEKLKTDPILAQELIKYKEEFEQSSSTGDDNVINEKIIPLAQKHGLSFTEDEFIEYSKSQLKELSDEDLMGITGGMRPRTAAIALAFTLGASFLSAGVMNMFSPTSVQSAVAASSSDSSRAKRENENKNHEDSSDKKEESNKNAQNNMAEKLKNKKVNAQKSNKNNKSNLLAKAGNKKANSPRQKIASENLKNNSLEDLAKLHGMGENKINKDAGELKAAQDNKKITPMSKMGTELSDEDINDEIFNKMFQQLFATGEEENTGDTDKSVKTKSTEQKDIAKDLKAKTGSQETKNETKNENKDAGSTAGTEKK